MPPEPPGKSRIMDVDVKPRDEHNDRLLDNVHPAGRANPEPRNPYNLVVIGAGTAGLVCAAGAAAMGARVALVETHLMGGDCLNYGCVPSKAIIRSASAAAGVSRAADFGVQVRGEVAIDFGSVMNRMRRLRAGISENDSVERFTSLGVDIFFGAARFTDPRTVEVGGRSLRFSRAVVATGARAAAPPIPGLAEAGYLTNETIFSLTQRPESLGVIGGGPIGCEMAQAFQRLGTRVTLIEPSEHLLMREDADAAGIIQEALRRDGVELILNAKRILRVSRQGAIRLIHHASQAGRDRDVAVEEILVATGRVPNVEGLGLREAGVRFDESKGVIVDDRLRTTNRRIFAAGDICSSYKFTHAADFMARTVIANALFLGRVKVSALTIPWCTFTDPQVAHVGITQIGAERTGLALDTFNQPLQGVDRAVLDGETEGFVKLHVKKGTDTILGATIVARHAGEMIGEVTLAMTHGLGLGGIARTIHPYPTQAEAIRRTGDLYNRTRLTPTVKRILSAWLRWRRGR